MTKMLCPSIFTIDGHAFTNLQFRVLRYFKNSDITLGLTALKKLNMVIRPSPSSLYIWGTILDNATASRVESHV